MKLKNSGWLDLVVVLLGVVVVKVIGHVVNHPISDELAWIMAFGWTILAKLRWYHEED